MVGSCHGFAVPHQGHKEANDVRCDVQAYDDLEHFETPFVVKLHRFNALANTQDVFNFEHPNRDAIIDNTRWAHRLLSGPWSWVVR